MNNKKLILLIPFILFFLGCSADITKPRLEDIIVYPSPPEPTKIQYLTSFTSSKDVLGEQSGIVDYVAGEEEEIEIIKPYGISIFKGKIYICDSILGGLEILDLENRAYEILQPKGIAQFKKPINCFKDENGYLYVVDSERAQVMIFDSLDVFITAFGEDTLNRPTDVFVTNDKIFISDIKDGNIKVFSKEDHSLLNVLGKIDLNENTRIYQPTNITIKDNKLYVSDFGDFKIKIYNTNGAFLDSVGNYGRNLGQFVRPKGIAVDDSLNLYVVDSAFENVQIFNKDGKLLMFFGGTYKKPGDMWLPAKVIIDYNNLEYFQKYVYEGFDLKYLIFVTNQYGPDKVNVYGFVEEKKSAE